MKFATKRLAAAIACIMCAMPVAGHAGEAAQPSIRSLVDSTIRPLMTKDQIPGMAVAVTLAGKVYVFDYGVASMKTRQPVTRETMFELGSVTKTFTATLASWAQVNHYLTLSDDTAKYLPSMQGRPFGKVSLLNLGTHTPGGFPLQVPDDVTNDTQLMQYLQQWHPKYAPGTYRTYSNPGIGMLGFITAKSMGQDFATLIDRQLFPALGIKNSFINIPASKMADYAEGYTKDGKPIRMTAGELWAEAYGVRATAADMIRFVEENMNLIKLDDKLQRAITDTHTGYYKAGPLTQDLIWEQYRYPVSLKTLLAGNASEIILDPTPASELKPHEQPQGDTWLNKTGSTNGFGSYVAFVPERRCGVVLLANKNYPIKDRVTIAYSILTSLCPNEGAGTE